MTLKGKREEKCNSLTQRGYYCSTFEVKRYGTGRNAEVEVSVLFLYPLYLKDEREGGVTSSSLARRGDL